ncbi:MAG: response regulator [Armatimonadetes bacterium]|nr:response regulator [Armatimonadota bacterium]
MISSSVYRVLLVEDNPGDADLAREGLADITSCSFETRHVVSLRDALQTLSKEKVDAVVLDLNLPDSQGLETLRAIQRHGEDSAIVVLSGAATHDMVIETLRTGAMDFVDKNAAPAQLIGRAVVSALRRNEAFERHRQTERLVSVNPDAMLVVDSKNVVQFVNEAALTLFGKERHELVGQTLFFSVREGRTTEIEVISKRETRFGEMNVVDISWNGAPAILASVRDVTRQRILTSQLQQSQKLQALGTLAAGIAHDLNNILNVVVGNAQLAKMQSDMGQSTEDTIASVVDAGNKGREFVSRILDFTRKRQSSLGAVDLEATVNEVANLVRTGVPLAVKLNVRCEEKLPKIYADPVQINQVILNLCSNAVQAIGDAPGQVDLVCELVSMGAEERSELFGVSEGPLVRLTVKDTGAGMSKEVQEQIFNPFFTTKVQGRGTGLGLAIVHNIMENHGGAITVQSELGKGTAFKLYFRLVTDLADLDTIEGRSMPMGTAQRVVYVDDDEALARIVRNQLRLLGYEIMAFTNSQDCLDYVRVKNDEVDLLIADYSMPYLDGISLIREVLLVRPDLPAVLASSVVRPEDIEAAKEVGAIDCVCKPFTIEEMADSMAKIFELVEARNAVRG